jgi:putative FmdB family regulatory protein
VDGSPPDDAQLALDPQECQPGGTDVPTYQYACRACGEQLEAVQSFSEPSLTECPSCAGELRKVFTAVGVVFKGSGFYKTDSRSASTSTDKPADSKSDGKAESKSESSSAPAAKTEASTSEKTSVASSSPAA